MILEENIKNSFDLGLGKNILRQDNKGTTIKEKKTHNKQNLINTKNFWSIKVSVTRIEIKAIDQKKIISKCISFKRFASRIYDET